MWKIFLKWGRVIDIYIPDRKDRTGRRFGFVKFLDIQNPKDLEVKLDNIWLGTYKLRVNIPRFVKGAERGDMKKDYTFNGPVRKGNFIVGNNSLANVVVGGRSNEPSNSRPGLPQQNQRKPIYKGKNNSAIDFIVTEDDMAWLKGSYVGKTTDPEGLWCIRKKFQMEQILSVTLTPMGGNLVLINAASGTNLDEAFKANSDAFSRWFTEIRPWEPTMVARERSIWMKLLGVPAHIWGEYFFKSMAQLLGKYVTIDDSTRERVRLDVGRVLITTTVPEIINRVFRININGTLHSIRVLEESFGDNYNRFYSNWKYQQSDVSSSDDEDSKENSILVVGTKLVLIS